MSALYHLKSVNYSYQWNGQDVPVLKGIDLEVPRGCFTCIVGPSGTGKTTLLNLLGLVDTPTSGQIHFIDQETSQLAESKKEGIRLKNIGFIFQSFYLIPTLTVFENTSYFLPLLGLSTAQVRKVTFETLEIMGLQDHAQKKPLELSGGQRQRVAISRALAKKPAVILADEPTANLDSQTAEKIIGAFKHLQHHEKTSFIFSTHDSNLIKYTESVYRIQDGHISKGFDHA